MLLVYLGCIVFFQFLDWSGRVDMGGHCGTNSVVQTPAKMQANHPEYLTQPPWFSNHFPSLSNLPPKRSRVETRCTILDIHIGTSHRYLGMGRQDQSGWNDTGAKSLRVYQNTINCLDNFWQRCESRRTRIFVTTGCQWHRTPWTNHALCRPPHPSKVPQGEQSVQSLQI